MQFTRRPDTYAILLVDNDRGAAGGLVFAARLVLQCLGQNLIQMQ